MISPYPIKLWMFCSRRYASGHMNRGLGRCTRSCEDSPGLVALAPSWHVLWHAARRHLLALLGFLHALLPLGSIWREAIGRLPWQDLFRWSLRLSLTSWRLLGLCRRGKSYLGSTLLLLVRGHRRGTLRCLFTNLWIFNLRRRRGLGAIGCAALYLALSIRRTLLHRIRFALLRCRDDARRRRGDPDRCCIPFFPGR
jgi:hypothetical protein